MGDLQERLVKGEMTPDDLPGETLFWRFNAYHRIVHYIIIVTFMGLVYTGMPLKYRNAGWAHWMMSAFGGVHNAGIIHRICGGITWAYLISHIIWLSYYLIVLRGAAFGPTSMLPRWKDAQDFVGNFKYFLGLGPQPKFDRYTYWEKFDWIAVFWGCMMIGFSGLMLWFPTIFAKLLPGISFNIATIIHSDEAVLATGFIFVVHWFNAHWRLEKLPFDPVVFTGKVSKAEMMHEKPLEWERMSQDVALVVKRMVKA